MYTHKRTEENIHFIHSTSRNGSRWCRSGSVPGKSNEKGAPQTFNGSFAYNTEETSDKTAIFDYTIKANLAFEKMPDLNLVLSGKGNYEIGKTMTLPIVNEGNAINLANTSKVEMEKINEQMGQGFTNYILGNPALMQMVLSGMFS